MYSDPQAISPASRDDDAGANNLSGRITRLIEKWVAEANAVQLTRYRTPLVAFANAADPRFQDLQHIVPGHLHPHDLLPTAQSVCVFFLPFVREVVRSNRDSPWASESWARAYAETNSLLTRISERLTGALAPQIQAVWQPPTHNFDPVRLVSVWSHKSVAAIAGLGYFGHHQMLITREGCAGRFSSVVLDAAIPATSPPQPASYCAYDRGCRVCIQRCPVGALTESGFDRTRCYARCLENDERFPDFLADVCGKCATGPCATKCFE